MVIGQSEKRTKQAPLLVALLGVLALSCAVVALKDPFVEQWHLRQLDSGDEDTRRHAAARLADLGSARAVPRLVALFKEQPSVLPAARTPGNWFATGIRAPPELSYAAKALIRIGAPAVGPLSETIAPPPEEPYFTAVPDLQQPFNFPGRVLVGIGEDAIVVLVRRLAHEATAVRVTAAYGIREFARAHEDVALPRLQSVVEALAVALQGPETDVRAAAADAFRRVALKRFLGNRLGTPEARQAAADALRAALDDPEESVRHPAVMALYHAVGHRGIEPGERERVASLLREVVLHENETMSSHAVSALGSFAWHGTHQKDR